VDSKRELVALKCVFTSKIVMDSTRELVDSYWIPTDSMVRNNHWTKLLRTRNYFHYSSYPANFIVSIAYESDHQCLFLNHPVPQIRPSSALTRPKLKESPKMGLSL